MTVSIRTENLELVYKVRRKLSLAPGRRHIASTGGNIGGKGRNRFVTALDDVSFELKSGDRLGLVGPNGSGKSTLLKVLYGVLKPTSGTVEIEGRVDALFNINLGFRREASGRRNILLRGLVNGRSKHEMEQRTDDIIEFSELGEFIDMPLKSYSQGMAARLAFAISTTLEPEILLMDEWIGAGDSSFQEKARMRMNHLATSAGIVVLASHNFGLLKNTCNKILAFDTGKVKYFGDLEGYEGPK